MTAQGRVHTYGDNVDTDVIIPARYLNTSSHEELAAHCMEDIDKDFVSRVRPGDILVARKNFGCGSSREHAPIAIKASGISCVIASTFARIFYRNAINIGLAILECDEAARDQSRIACTCSRRTPPRRPYSVGDVGRPGQNCGGKMLEDHHGSICGEFSREKTKIKLTKRHFSPIIIHVKKVNIWQNWRKPATQSDESKAKVRYDCQAA